ncbi:aminotransferase class III-fold pyridoxal phosphate-dependent enzyme [Streptomyces sp. NPDC047072]|uniref:aminotransferase class III-fold pyridoxal phosphate-dependent enzyme n=1 Tax=Streptomyces sp. NPDC047072 TaxID=3154809 RepID=UPI0033EE50E3
MPGGVVEGASVPRATRGSVPRRQPARESAARTYARALPIVPVRARGLTIEGADGRRYLDCLSGAGTLALGHNHPVVLEAIREVLDSGAPLDVPDLPTPVQEAFVIELLRTLPPGLADRARVQFCGPTATDAVQAASRLVRTATGRPDILAFTDAHGTYSRAASEAPSSSARATRLPYPQDYRRPFGIGGPYGAELAARWTESLLDDPRPEAPQPAGMILEPVQNEGGFLPAPDSWLRRMRQITADRSIPLIVDESHTGVGRTGAFWAVDHSGITPDAMILSQAIGGSLPLAVLVHRDDLDTGEPDTPAGPFRGNQLAMAAGTATMAYVRENALTERAATLGTRMLTHLRQLAREFPVIGDVRGRGLMIGLEMVDPAGDIEHIGPGFGERGGCDAEPALFDLSENPPAPNHAPVSEGAVRTPLPDPNHPDGEAPAKARLLDAAGADWPGRRTSAHGIAERTPAPSTNHTADSGTAATTSRPRPAAPELAAAIQRECLRRGLIVDLGGHHTNVVRLLPPLTITDEQTNAVLDRLTDAVATVAGEYRAGGVGRVRGRVSGGDGRRGGRGDG